jgi:hypothetical protein
MVSKEEMLRMAGFPTDPKIDELERKLSELAYEWRRTKKSKLVRQYHKTYRELQGLGWNERLDFDSRLPDELMPSAKKETKTQGTQRERLERATPSLREVGK